MPRKTTRKGTAVDLKNDEIAPRRSGRSVTKPEPSAVKDASRSRRSSTAAQTVASVADSKSPKTRAVESTPPSDSRTRRGREGLESPATRVKSTRRSTSRINYKESDGEEEVPTPKYDENFDSGDEFDDSESDEKSKLSGRNKSNKATAKSRGSKENAEGSARGRRGRPSKKKTEESKTFVISDDSMEPEIVETKTDVKNKVTPKRTRGRKSKSEVIDVEPESETKPSRRSARAASNKDESPKKRPSRSVKAKRYTEDEEEDIEEIIDSKVEEEEVEEIVEDKLEKVRKRKRESTPEESHKRVKKNENEGIEIEKVDTEEKAEVEKSLLENKNLSDEDSDDEPMEIDESDSGIVSQDSIVQEKEKSDNLEDEKECVDKKENVIELKEQHKKSAFELKEQKEITPKLKEQGMVLAPELKEQQKDSAPKSKEQQEESAPSEEQHKESTHSKKQQKESTPELEEDQKEITSESKEKQKESTSELKEKQKESTPELKEKENKSIPGLKEKQEESTPQLKGQVNDFEKQSIENSDKIILDLNSESPNPTENSTSSNLKDFKKRTEILKDDILHQEPPVEETVNQNALDSQPMDVSPDSEKVHPIAKSSEANLEPEKIIPIAKNDDKPESLESYTNDMNTSNDNKPVPAPSALVTQTENCSVPEMNAHSTELISDPTLNGKKQLHNFVNPSRNSTANLESPEASLPKANGAHEDMHMNLSQLRDSYCSLPGRKYVQNSKLNENVMQSIKNQIFGFLSYNLGSDTCVQKDKLLKELCDFNSHIICLQQVPKPLFLSVLQPSLDALGYKSVFSQPEDSLKGIATFFKSSQFRLNNHFDISLKRLIDKELETSSLEPTSKTAVKSYIKRCGNVLLTHLASVIGTKSVIVANVQIPPSDLSTHALQVSCLAREIIKINGGTMKPLLIGGEFNISEKDASYQLLRDGYLTNDMIDELQKRKDITVPEKENSSLVDILWKSFQHPSSNLCSCYTSVLDHELFIPELKKASPDLLWYSSDSLQTVGVVDITSDKSADHHISLKADVAFTV